jgi:alpha,alpha-trehalose phosphorylase
LHMASLAGTWLAAVAGFGGMRDHSDLLSFAPRLPRALTRLSFRLNYRGRRLRVEVNHDTVGYELLEGDDLDVLHQDEVLRVSVGMIVTRKLPRVTLPPAVQPPSGRNPLHKGIGAEASGPGSLEPPH